MRAAGGGNGETRMSTLSFGYGLPYAFAAVAACAPRASSSDLFVHHRVRRLLGPRGVRPVPRQGKVDGRNPTDWGCAADDLSPSRAWSLLEITAEHHAAAQDDLRGPFR